MYELSIKAESLDELKRMATALASGLSGTTSHGEGVPVEAGPGDSDRLRKALREIYGDDAKRFYLDVAEGVLRGESVQLDRALLDRYGKTSGQAFSGIQAGATRVIDRHLHRRVIVTDPVRGGYSMSHEDAEIVVEVLGKKHP